MNVAEALKSSMPVWFDGTFLYRKDGKYEWDPVTNHWKKLHDLTTSGMLKWFEPCFEHNEAMLKLYEEQQALEHAREQEQIRRREAARLENERWQRRADGIGAYIKANKTKGKRQDVEIALHMKQKETVSAMVYGSFAVHCHHVTHIPTGMSVGSFSNADSAKRYVWALNTLHDWETVSKAQHVPKDVQKLCRILKRYCACEGVDIHEIDLLADRFGVPA